MKTLSQEELKQKAAEVFKGYRRAQKVAVTSDGMAFITDNGKNAVLNHSKKNSYGKELKISEYTRDEIEGSESGTKEKTAKVVLEEIEAATEPAVVEAILKLESSGQKRKTVLKAAEKKLNELKPAE